MEWIATYWPFVAGWSTLIFGAGVNVQMLREVRKDVREINGTVRNVDTTTAACQAIQSNCPHRIGQCPLVPGGG